MQLPPEIDAWIRVVAAWVLLPALSAVGGAGLLGLVLRRYLIERITAAIKHDYDRKLESYRDELQRDSDAELEKLRRFNAEQLEVQKAAIATFQTSHGAAFERRLKAIEAIWNAFLEILRKTPSAVAFTDVLLEQEYAGLLANDRYRQLLNKISYDDVKAMTDATETAERGRPFSNDALYGPLFVYRAVIGRIMILLIDGRDRESVKPWYRDSLILQNLAVILTPTEMDQFKNLKLSQYSWARLKLEAKFLAAAQKLILGGESADRAIEESERLRDALRPLESERLKQNALALERQARSLKGSVRTAKDPTSTA